MDEEVDEEGRRPDDVPGDEFGGLEVWVGGSVDVGGVVSVLLGDSDSPVDVGGGLLSDVVPSPGVEVGLVVGSVVGSELDEGGEVVELSRFTG